MAFADEKAKPTLDVPSEALRALANEAGEVTQDDLRKDPNFSESAAELVIDSLGSGPWHLSQLTQFIASHKKANERVQDQEEVDASLVEAGASAANAFMADACATDASAIDASASDASTADASLADAPKVGAPATDASEGSGHPSEWRTKQLNCLHSLLDKTLRNSENAEDDLGAVIGEDAELDAINLQRGIMRHVVVPLQTSPMNPSGGAEVLWKSRMQQLPRAVDELSLLLQKSLRLVHIHERKHNDLRSSLQNAKEEIRQEQERMELERQRRIEAKEQAGHDEQAQTLLETTLQRLNAARQTIREREQELMDLRNQVDLMFSEKAQQDERVQKLEVQVQEAEAHQTQGSSVSSEMSETALASQRTIGELRRRASVAEQALDGAKEILRASDEACASKDRRIAELEARLREIESSGLSRPCMQRSSSALESLGGTHTPRTDDIAEQASLRKGRRSLPGWSLSKPVEEETPQNSARQSRKKRVSTGSAGGMKQSSSQSSLQSKGQTSTAGGVMPGDLRSLGRLLSASDSSGSLLDGFFGKSYATQQSGRGE